MYIVNAKFSLPPRYLLEVCHGHWLLTKLEPCRRNIFWKYFEPPVVISIFDCSDHISEGGTKMLLILNKYSKNSCQVWSSYLLLPALMYIFDGTSHVQKTGEIPCITYSWAFCFHEKMYYSYSWVIWLISNQLKWVN